MKFIVNSYKVKIISTIQLNIIKNVEIVSLASFITVTYINSVDYRKQWFENFLKFKFIHFQVSLIREIKQIVFFANIQTE